MPVLRRGRDLPSAGRDRPAARGRGPHAKRVSELLDGDESVARLVLGAIGLSDAAVQAEETSWALRRLLERVAQERPLVVVVEDVHWAEPTLLDFLEYLVAFSSGQPILLVCIARPEFVEKGPAWVALQPTRSLLVLDALSDAEARQLVESAGADDLGSATSDRIVETAEGNPLFLEQLVAVGVQSGEAALPSTIQAVLAARIDRLARGERAVLEHASIQGRSFFAGAVEELLGERDRAGIATHLVSLVQQQLVRADRSDVPGQDAFRFAHVLIREAAYQACPSSGAPSCTSAWPAGSRHGRALTTRPSGTTSARPIASLPSSARGRSERGLAVEAADRLAAASSAALLRGDPTVGARLLERAESLPGT